MRKILFTLLILLNLTSCAVKAPEKGVFYTAGTWDIPPAYHGNPWAPGGMNTASVYIYEPLFDYIPTSRVYIPRLGESFKISKDNLILTVKLKKGVFWHDGKKFSGPDVRTTFYTGYIKNMEIWKNLKDIECPDEHTVVFIWKEASPLNIIRALTERITSPAHIFGHWVDLIAEMKNKNLEGNEIKDQKIREVLYKYRPELPVGTGPFRIKKVTSSDIILEKFSDYHDKNKVSINKVHIVRWGTNQVVWSYLLCGDVDGVTPACPYDVSREILKKNKHIHLFTPSDKSEYGLIYNCKKKPVNDLAMRQAIAHILDRDMIRQIACTYGDTVDDYSTGIPKSSRKEWFDEKFYKSLTLYDHNLSKAEHILLNNGYRKNKEKNYWLTSENKKISLDIIAPDLNDVILLAEAASGQLNKFGFFSEIRIVPLDLYGTAVKNSEFHLAADIGPQLSKYGHPSFSFNCFYKEGELIQSACGLPSELMGEHIPEIIKKLDKTFDPAEEKELVRKLARITNETLPFISCYEKRILFFTLDGRRVTGWPRENDEIWNSAPGNLEGFYCTLIVTGKLKTVN